MARQSLTANLKELHPDAGEHELQQGGDDHDVANSSDGYKHTLHHMLQDTETEIQIEPFYPNDSSSSDMKSSPGGYCNAPCPAVRSACH